MITAEILKAAILNAAKNISENIAQVDSINVFPVPDGDTGANLAQTLSGCAKAVENSAETNVGALAEEIANELFKNAEGNSGIIFSFIFKGFAKSVEGLEVIDASALAKGLEAGCDEAYASVEKPTEGTILTVIRIAASKATSAASKGKNAYDTFIEALNGARASLKSTTNLLPALKKHGFVDAGALGLVYIMEGVPGVQSNSEPGDTK